MAGFDTRNLQEAQILTQHMQKSRNLSLTTGLINGVYLDNQLPF